LVIWLKAKKDKMVKTVQISPFKGIPMAPGVHWFLGHVKILQALDGSLRGQKTVYADYADKNGMSAYWSIMNKPSYVLLEGKDAKAVFNASSTKPSFSYISNHLQQFLGKKSLLVLQEKEWKLHRSTILRSFTPTVVDKSQEVINNVGNTLAESLLVAIDESNDQCLLT
jgi:cytochrome P450